MIGLGVPNRYHHLVNYSREEGGCGGLHDWGVNLHIPIQLLFLGAKRLPFDLSRRDISRIVHLQQLQIADECSGGALIFCPRCFCENTFTLGSLAKFR